MVERRTELVGFTDEREHITAYLRGPAGHEDVCAASYIAGCDGARSTCARSSELVFPAAPIGRSSVADVEAAGPAVNGELQVDLDEVDFLAIFPLAKKTRARLIGTVRDVSGLSRPR